MRTLISLGIAFFVIVLNWLVMQEFTSDLDVEMAGAILFMAFIGTAVTTSVVLKYRRGSTAVIPRILISLGAGIVNLAFLYGTCALPNPRMFVSDAARDIGISASLVSLVTFVLLSLPTPLPDKWRKVLISFSAAFFVAVFTNMQIISFVEYPPNLPSVFAGVFTGTAVITSLVLSRWGRHR